MRLHKRINIFEFKTSEDESILVGSSFDLKSTQLALNVLINKTIVSGELRPDINVIDRLHTITFMKQIKT